MLGNLHVWFGNEQLIVRLAIQFHKAWEAAGGKTQAAKIANKASQKAKRQKNKD